MHRCPFCHDELDPASPRRVACAACGAEHHAECFVEATECAATACQHRTVRVGRTELDAEALARLLDDPEQLEALQAEAPSPRKGSLAAMGALLVVFGLALLGSGLGEGAGGPILIGTGAVALGALLTIAAALDTDGVRVAHPADQPLDFDPIFGTWTSEFVPGLPADPTGGLGQALRDGAGPATAPPPGAPPAECPECARPIEPSPQPDLFCYHCGADRVTADGTRWRQPGEPEGEELPAEKPLPPRRVPE